MTWTQGQLDALEAAIATGALEYEYQGKRVRHHSLEKMLMLRDKMKAELGQLPISGASTLAEYHSGLTGGS